MLVAVTAIALGCSSSKSSDSASEGPGFNQSGTGGQSFNSNPVTSVTFSPDGTVLLKPGDTASRTVLITPASVSNVSLALLEGSTDAALSESVIQTSADGIAEFSITASSSSASFDIRASVGQISATLSVSVSDKGYSTVNLTGSYAGVRSVSEWVATLQNGVTCLDIGPNLPGDGTLAVKSNTPPGKFAVANVPVGPVQSFVIRGDHSVWGCKDAPSLSPGGTVDLQVPLYDVPATYGPNPIPVVYTITSNTDAWATLLASAKPTVIDAFENSAASDVDLLLDTMYAAIGDTQAQAEFNQRRVDGNWHTLLANEWSALDGSSDQCLRTALDKWLTSGASKVNQGITFDTTMQLTSASTSLSEVQLTLTSMGGFAQSDCALSAQVPLATSFGSNDGLAATTTLTFNDALFLRLLALAPAQVQFPAATDIPNALATLVHCDTMGSILDGAAPLSSHCNAECLTNLCSAALLQLWANTASAVSQRASSRLTLNCSGTLQMDPNAVVRDYLGNWVGLITSPTGNVPTGGPIG